MSPVRKAALIRALIVGAVSAGFAAVAWAATKPEYAVAAGIAGAFLTRFAAEGQFDVQRDQAGDVREGDVGASLTYPSIFSRRGR
jgi:hypothetical protein